MRSKKIFNTIILIMVVMVLTMPIKLFAADDLWEELGGTTNSTTKEESNTTQTPSTNEPENTTTQTPTTKEPETTTPSTNNSNSTNNDGYDIEFGTPTSKPSTNTTTNTAYNKAGLAEDSIMIVSIVALGAIAVYTFKKLNQYKNI